jgi:hypothetical protein
VLTATVVGTYLHGPVLARNPRGSADAGCAAVHCTPEPPEPAQARPHTVAPMLSAWVLVTLTSLVALACAYGAYRLARRPKGTRR